MPFKLTREMVMVLGGKHAPLYRETFLELCVAAMRAARAHGQALLSLCEMTAYRYPYTQALTLTLGAPIPVRDDRLPLRAALLRRGRSQPGAAARPYPNPHPHPSPSPNPDPIPGKFMRIRTFYYLPPKAGFNWRGPALPLTEPEP